MEHDREGREGSRGPAQRARQADAPLPGLFGLQRAAGNAAVAGALQRQVAGTGAGGRTEVPVRVNVSTTARFPSSLIHAMADQHGADMVDSQGATETELSNAS